MRVNYQKQEIYVDIPLTTQTGKTRVKVRNTFADYGEPTATRRIPFGLHHYIEWQIGYDVTEDAIADTTLQHLQFIGANGKLKCLYELSEIIHYLKDFGAISPQQIQTLTYKLEALAPEDFIENSLHISRDAFMPRVIAGLSFLCSHINYPLAIYRFNGNLISEVIVREKQRAVGVQPMLYFCFPVTNLLSITPLIGRTANQNECATLVIRSDGANDYLKMLEIFGILSKSHNHDILEILRVI
ncbi:MAG: R.Pab1 family restriction endonuclease [Wolinella sp.]